MGRASPKRRRGPWRARGSWALRWGGLAAVVAILGVFVISLRWTALLPGVGNISIGRAALLVWGPYRGFRPIPRLFVEEVALSKAWAAQENVVLLPSLWRNRSGFILLVPLWMPLVVLSIPTALAWWGWGRAQRRARIGACRCGYDLTGNSTGICPECGKAAVP